MTTETAELKAKFDALVPSLEALEALLRPLLDRPLPDTLASLDKIQQAKLCALVPYLVYDLIFVYLKSSGVNPQTHPVVDELSRVRQYFDKIKEAETSPSRATVLDKEAAERFIKHAISQAQVVAPSPADDTPARGPSTPVPIKVTSKMREREQYHRDLKGAENEGEEEENLAVFDAPQEPSPHKGKGKAREGDLAETWPALRASSGSHHPGKKLKPKMLDKKGKSKKGKKASPPG